MNDYVIEAKTLTRYYGTKRGIRDLDLSVHKGTVFALVGENGAGKTTFMRMCLGLLSPDRGELAVLGEDPVQMSLDVKQKIAFLSEDQGIFDWMTVGQVLRFNGSFYPQWDDTFAEGLVKDFELQTKDKIGTLSRGFKRRVGIVLALAQQADLLVLDEPAAGLDTRIRRKFLDKLIDVVQDSDRTVFISSHMLGDLERVTDHLALIHEGAIRISGSLDDLRDRTKQITTRNGPWVDDLKNRFVVLRTQQQTERTLLDVADYSDQKLQGLPEEAQVQVDDLNLEDLFIALLGKD